MPIHDQGYRRYAGVRGAHGHAWWVIARAALRSSIRQPRIIALLLAAWVPFLVYAVRFYLAVNFEQASAVLGPTPGVFRDLLDLWQGVFVFFFTILIGAGLIADDRRANALQIYLSKPLSRVEYIVGKTAVLVIFLGAITWLPAMLLLLVQVLLAGSLSFLRENVFLIPAITLFSAVQVLTYALLILALSSLSKSRRFVAMTFAGVVLFTQALAAVLGRITGASAWAWISPEDTLDVIADAAFRVQGRPALPLLVAVVTVIVLFAGSVLVLERRVRGVEVVA
jgi:ABC-type transport system involved in multi-copper enzyme maturation permease subunit